MTRKDKIRFLIFRSIGNFLLLISLYGVFVTFSPVFSQEFRVRIEKARGITYTVKTESEISRMEKPKIRLNPQGALKTLLDDEKEHILMPIDPLFSILIPGIGASERVIANVDPQNREEFLQVLRKGVAHAKGTVFPGMPGNTYLFSHSADNWWNAGRYNAVFYLLKDLEKGDDIVVFFENRRYNYLVSGKYIADPSEVSLLVKSRGIEERLILQTCWPPGTTWKRLFIVAVPKSS